MVRRPASSTNTSANATLTAGSGADPSAVSSSSARNAFNRRYGIAVIDADIAARQVVVPGSPGLSEVVELFGEEILDSDGAMDRRHVRRLVFEKPELRRRLESILHPLIRDQMMNDIEQARSSYCLVCIPLLNDRAKFSYLKRILVVDCTEETQIRRVMSRDQLTRDEVIAIMRTQLSRSDRQALADDVILNDADCGEFEVEIEKLHEKFSRLSAN